MGSLSNEDITIGFNFKQSLDKQLEAGDIFQEEIGFIIL
jgi:hypothetical protein